LLRFGKPPSLAVVSIVEWQRARLALHELWGEAGTSDQSS
jgi:hypothetical protein